MARQEIAETLVASTARAIARMSLTHREGEFIGGEGELLARLRVSRPTLRQAAKIVENERMVSIRRGTKGGFYAARPDTADAIRMLSSYLRLRGATLADLLVVIGLAAEEAAGLAAQCPDAGLRARLDGFASRIADFDTPGDVVAAENELMALTGRMSGNAALELVMAIGFFFGAEERGLSLYRLAEERRQARALQAALCEAILDRDPDIARLMMRRRLAMLSDWVERATMR